jgi:hypothetical protein
MSETQTSISPGRRIRWTIDDSQTVEIMALEGHSPSIIGEAVGRTSSAVLAHIKKLGLRKDRRGQITIARRRPCMCCRQSFASEGKHNRLCRECTKKGDHWLPGRLGGAA